MEIAASIVRAHPALADDREVLMSILNGIKKAILDERDACQAEAEKHFDYASTNRPEFSDIEVAVLFTKNAVSANIVKDIGDRGAP